MPEKAKEHLFPYHGIAADFRIKIKDMSGNLNGELPFCLAVTLCELSEIIQNSFRAEAFTASVSMPVQAGVSGRDRLDVLFSSKITLRPPGYLDQSEDQEPGTAYDDGTIAIYGVKGRVKFRQAVWQEIELKLLPYQPEGGAP